MIPNWAEGEGVREERAEWRNGLARAISLKPEGFQVTGKRTPSPRSVSI